MNESATISLHPRDNIAIARRLISVGAVANSEAIVARTDIPAGHKIATAVIPAGESVRRYGQIIGIARETIERGDHVHTHNLLMQDFDRDYAIGVDARPVDYIHPSATFQGIVRADGRVATRNYVGILTTVNCSATVAKRIAAHFDEERLARFPHVDGVVAFAQPLGCCIDDKGEGIAMLRRTLLGYARHPNFAAILVIGLGCETNQIGGVFGELGNNALNLHAFTIQDEGGTSKAIARGIGKIEELLPGADQARRESVSASSLIMGLECGGSDGYSGITANPALGAAADLLVRHGGAAVLSETPEIFGAEHLLTRRASSESVASKLIARVRWWEEHAQRNGSQINNNPTPGNKAGGITTILEKSLGAVAKGGTMPLEAVYEYAEPITSKGFSFMDTPGYDPMSVTGLVAGGANIVCFTTGRGSAFGCAPSPSLKLSTNTALWENQNEDLDINCGSILDGGETVESMGEKIFQLVLDTASGAKTKSEQHGYGHHEFVPWFVGAVL